MNCPFIQDINSITAYALNEAQWKYPMGAQFKPNGESTTILRKGEVAPVIGTGIRLIRGKDMTLETTAKRSVEGDSYKVTISYKLIPRAPRIEEITKHLEWLRTQAPFDLRIETLSGDIFWVRSLWEDGSGAMKVDAKYKKGEYDVTITVSNTHGAQILLT